METRILTFALLLPAMLVLLFSVSSQAQDYTSYYEHINRAEEKFVTKRDTSCFTDFDRAFSGFKPFLKDPFVAAQIAFHLQDTVRFYKYLELCFQNGMPLSAVGASPIVRRVLQGSLKRSVELLYQSTHVPFDYDEEEFDAICLMCYQSDSLKVFIGGRSDEFELLESHFRDYLLNRFLAQGLFPNERLFGISTNEREAEFHRKFNREDLFANGPFSSSQEHFEEHELRLKCPLNIVLHSKCFYTNHKELFLTAMRNGYLHPKEIGILEETAMLWNRGPYDGIHEGDCNPQIAVAYNIFSPDPRRSAQVFDASAEALLRVEENRRQIHMQKYSVDVRKKELEKELGIKFFFDFVDR